MAQRSRLSLQRELKQNTKDLAGLNRELATQMILLASQTGETEPLQHAVQALRKVDDLYSSESTPRENAELRQQLADTLFTLARTHDDTDALADAITAYRDAITLASVIGDEAMRTELKRNYSLARNLMGTRGRTKGAA